MKTNAIILLIAACTLTVHQSAAQSFGALGPANSTGGAKCFVTDPSGSTLYAGGTLTSAGGTSVASIAAWNGSSWSALGAGLTGNPGSYYVEDMVFFNGTLHAGGYINGSGGSPLYGIASWDGSTWNNLSNGVSGYIKAMAVYGGKLYVGGNLGIVDGTPSVWTDGFFPGTLACWDGTQWDTIPVAYPGSNNVHHMTVWNGKLYAGGDFGELYEFDGSNWTDVSLGQITHEVSAFAEYDGKLMIAELTWGGEGKIWQWDGSALTLFQGGFDGRIRGIVAHQGNLFVAGQCDEVSGFAFEGITYWDGTQWNIINQGISGNVEELIVFNGQIVLADIQFDKSDWSYYGTIGTLDMPTPAAPPATPTGLVAKFIQDTTAVLTWDTSATATSYKLVYKVAGTASWQHVAWKHTQQGQKTITGLLPGTTYKWAIFAINSHGYSAIAPMSTFSTLSGPCTIPTGLSATGVSGNQARLNWLPAANAVKYRIRYREAGSGGWTVLVKDNSWDKHWLTGLSLSTTYEWQIKSVCSYGPSSGTMWSATQSFTTASAKNLHTTEVETPATMGLQAYPNPSSDGQFRVAGLHQAEQATVYNLLGQPVWRGQLQNGTELDLGAFGSGVYILKCHHSGHEIVRRLIVR